MIQNIARDKAIQNLESTNPRNVAHWVEYNPSSDVTELHLVAFIDGRYEWKDRE